MANEWIIKDYAGGAVGTTLNGNISGGVTSITVVSGSTFPDGSSGYFVVCIDAAGTAEKVLCSSRSGNVLTVANRGYDGTAAVAHLTGVTVTHTLDALSIKQANALAAIMDTAGSMAYRGSGFSYVELELGATGLPIVAGASAPEYGTIGLAALAAAVSDLLVPGGVIAMTPAATADTGWALLDGSTVTSCQSLYPATWARIPASWKSGANMVMPDARGATVFMDDAAALFTLGAVAGANTVTIAQANLPVVNLSADPANTAVSVTINDNPVDRVTRLTAASPGSYIALLDSDGNGIADAGGGGMAVGFETEHGHTGSGSVDLAAFNVPLGGSGTALDNRSKHLVVNFQIKLR